MPIEIYAVFLPLFMFAVVFLFGKILGDRFSQFLTCTGLIASATISVLLFKDIALGDVAPRTLSLMTWITSGDFTVDWAIRLDTLSVVMMCVIAIVSACVHVYSVGYMSHDKAKARFMSYLSLFTFMMLMLVTSDNLIQLFFGWEGVGLASYLLIGFWNHKHSANRAAMKAFIVNRVGDLGLALGVFTLFMTFGTVQFDGIFADAANATTKTFEFWGYELHALTLACVLLFIGACGKSAQLGLHMVARCDGRANARIRTYSRRDNGDGGDIPNRTFFTRLRIRARCVDVGHLCWCVHRDCGGDNRDDAI